jgi:phosphatidylglycerol:prolipoprotein diacylglycerol transferase
MLDFTPAPILVHLGPVPVYWYGICYALGLAAAYLVLNAEARRKALDADLIPNGMIIIAVAALIGGRAYHVIDQWALYRDDLPKIFLPPYTGLGVFGGLITGTLVGIAYIRWHRQSVFAWADVIAPALFAMQAIGRWGNFFNQELYGPPTKLPWGIPIECVHRIAAYPCSTYPFDTTRFHPLFLYESLAGLLGLVVLLLLARRAAHRLHPGSLLAIFFIWYGIVRFALETLRADNWTWNGIPTAWLFAGPFILAGLLLLAFVQRRGGPTIAEEDARRRAGRDGAASALDAAPERSQGPDELGTDAPDEASDEAADEAAEPPPDAPEEEPAIDAEAGTRADEATGSDVAEADRAPAEDAEVEPTEDEVPGTGPGAQPAPG